MADMTDKPSLVVQAIVDLLVGDWEKYAATKDDIYYGDQSVYARFPSIGVEPVPQERDLNQTGLQQRILFTVHVMVYHGGIKGIDKIKKSADETAEKVVERLHSDRRLGGLVIHGSVTSNEPGAATRGGQLLSANRITWEGLSNYTMPTS